MSDAELLQKMTWLVESAAPSLAPVRLLNLCHRLSTIEDVEKLVDSCNIEQ